jgi:hypothetical protein
MKFKLIREGGWQFLFLLGESSRNQSSGSGSFVRSTPRCTLLPRRGEYRPLPACCSILYEHLPGHVSGAGLIFRRLAEVGSKEDSHERPTARGLGCRGFETAAAGGTGRGGSQRRDISVWKRDEAILGSCAGVHVHVQRGAFFGARAFLTPRQGRTRKKSRVLAREEFVRAGRGREAMPELICLRGNMAAVAHVGSRRLAARTILRFEMRGR